MIRDLKEARKHTGTIWSKSIPGRRKNKCKGPETEACHALEEQQRELRGLDCSEQGGNSNK